MKTTVLVLCFAIASLVGPLAIAQNCGGIDWVAPTGAVPTARTGAAMAYDSFRGRLVLFGGQLVGGGVSSATWEFDGTQWQQVSPTGSPAARYGHAMVYDSARHVVVMFGGMLNGGTLSSGTYEYNGTAWTQRTVPGTPTARQGHAMAYDSVRGRVVLFGGLSATSLLSDTREYDGQVWQLISASGPTARQGHAMAFDESRHVTVLFGGRTSAVQPTDSDETWEWNGAAWSHLLITGPAARSGHCMAFDTSRGVAVLFGGIQGSTYLNSTWEYSAAGWLAAAPATDPSAKAGACTAFDAGRGRVVMCGGANGGVISAEAWELVASGAAPEFSLQPSPISAAPGEVVSFHSLADGAAGWRWVKDGQP